MRTSFRHTMIATTAVLALSAVAASAAAPVAGDPNGTLIQAAATTEHDTTARVEKRITDLHATLKITAAQQPQWDAFVVVMRDNAKTMDQSFQHRVTGMAAMNAADNMQSYADMATMHAQGMQKMVPSFKALYAVMSVEQKKIADEEFVERAHRGMDKPKG